MIKEEKEKLIQNLIKELDDGNYTVSHYAKDSEYKVYIKSELELTSVSTRVVKLRRNAISYELHSIELSGKVTDAIEKQTLKELQEFNNLF